MFKIAFKVQVHTIIDLQHQHVPPNKLSILGGFNQNNMGCQNIHLPRVEPKQNSMKKSKYIVIVWKSGKTED